MISQTSTAAQFKFGNDKYNLIPHFMMNAIAYPYWDLSSSNVEKEALGSLFQQTAVSSL